MAVHRSSVPRDDSAAAAVVSPAPGDIRRGDRSALFTRLGAPEFTSIPRAFRLSSPARPPAADGARHSKTFEAMRNEHYERRVAKHPEMRMPSRYHVPVNRPLPSRDWQTAREKRDGDSRMESSLAPLFSRCAEKNGEEAVQMEFLVPHKERRLMIEERRKEQEHTARQDPNFRLAYNEPKNLPQLNKKVPKDFVPQCAYVHSSR